MNWDGCGSSSYPTPDDAANAWNQRVSPTPSPAVRERVAPALYSSYSGNDPYIHANRWALWGDLKPEYKEQWLRTADAAIKAMEEGR